MVIANLAAGIAIGAAMESNCGPSIPVPIWLAYLLWGVLALCIAALIGMFGYMGYSIWSEPR